MKFCPMCGKPTDPSDKICGQCGARLFTDEPAPGAQPAQRTPPQQEAPQQQQQTGRPAQNSYDGRGASGGQRAAGVVGGYDRPRQGKNATLIIIALAAAVVILGAVLGVMALRGRGGDVSASVETPEVTLAPEEEEEETPVSDIPYYVTGVDGQISVRSSAGGSVVGWLENNDKVLILRDDGDEYWKVRSSNDDLTGYVDKHYLTMDAGSVTEPSTMYISGASSSLAVTEAQDSNWEVGSINNGDEVTVLAKTNGGRWYIYSEALHSYGYVSRDYLSTERPPDPTPTPEPTPAPTPSSGAGTALTFGYGAAPSNYTVYYASVATGYLALRNAKAYDASNEIGKIQNGEAVYVMTTPNETYWYVYAPTLGMYGYTNSDYLSSSGGYSAPSTTYYWTVSVKTGYLALRTAKAYDYKNEIGELYTGDKVEVLDSSDGTYWYVYSPKLGKYGYVNKNYLY